MEPTPPISVPRHSRWIMILGILLLIGGASYGSYWYFIEKQNFALDVDLSSSSASTGNPELILTPGSSSITTGQPGYVDIYIDAGTRNVSAVELHISVTGPASSLAFDTTDTAFQKTIKAASITGQTGTIILGVLDTPKSGNQKVARLTFTTGSVGTISISTSGSQAAATDSSSNILGAATTSSITVAAVVVNPPTASLTASPTTIKTGLLVTSTATLTWTHNGTSATITPAGVATSVGATGTATVSPTSTTTYTLTATNADGSTTKTVTINVQKVCDISGDGIVTIFDINPLIQNFGQSFPAADFNVNGTVDIFDYNIFVTNFATQKTP